ncbi:hypothetical protein [Methanobacterium spitsbergense]|uniref:Uncharacterized protein n=1 Tax=Methanobacterium spitsbergense TaxID=2874285 RepID=A0A8T5UX64_9EURY|nr:hypothetical protein [Methanobacterium spitsbergense]MBZ2165770.1 hypothetical protein [Methanobacterium spitsbergense]
MSITMAQIENLFNYLHMGDNNKFFENVADDVPTTNLNIQLLVRSILIPYQAMMC